MVLFGLVEDSENRGRFRQRVDFRAFALGEYIEGDEVGVRSVPELLGMRDEDLKPIVTDTLNRLYETETEPALTSLSRSIHGHYQFQDVIGVSLESDIPWQNRNYCYYESLVYLRESAVSWLDGNVLAATTLLRPFLELTMLHLYWYLRSRNEGYGRYYDWLSGSAGKPPFKNQVEYIFDNIPVKDCFEAGQLDGLRDDILALYKWGCIYNHTPKVEESLFHVAGGSQGTNKDLLVSLAYYPNVAAPLIEEVICTFMLVYPMSFFPVNRHEKWGFGGGPAGFYSDPTNGLILREAIGRNRFDFIRSEIEHSSEIKAYLEDFAQEPSLTEEALENSWTEFWISTDPAMSSADIPEAHWWAERVAMAKSAIRAFGWVINYAENPPNVEDLDVTL